MLQWKTQSRTINGIQETRGFSTINETPSDSHHLLCYHIKTTDFIINSYLRPVVVSKYLLNHIYTTLNIFWYVCIWKPRRWTSCEFDVRFPLKVACVLHSAWVNFVGIVTAVSFFMERLTDAGAVKCESFMNFPVAFNHREYMET